MGQYILEMKKNISKSYEGNKVLKKMLLVVKVR